MKRLGKEEIQDFTCISVGHLKDFHWMVCWVDNATLEETTHNFLNNSGGILTISCVHHRMRLKFLKRNEIHFAKCLFITKESISTKLEITDTTRKSHEVCY